MNERWAEKKMQSLTVVTNCYCLRAIVHELEESAFECVAKRLNYKTGRFLKRIKGEKKRQKENQEESRDLNEAISVSLRNHKKIT